MNYTNQFYFTDGDLAHPVPTETINEVLRQHLIASFENQNGVASRYTKEGDTLTAHIFISHWVTQDHKKIPAIPQV